MTCCGAVFKLELVDRKQGDSTILHELSRRRCGKKVSRYFKITFTKTPSHPEFEPEFVNIYSLCASCAKEAPGIFTEKYEIPDTVLAWEKLAKEFNMQINRVDTRRIFGCYGQIKSIEECDKFQEKIVHQEREMAAIKTQLKAAIGEIELRLHVADPGIWRHIFNEVVDELIVEGIMKA
jgi:hypothetical protein